DLSQHNLNQGAATISDSKKPTSVWPMAIRVDENNAAVLGQGWRKGHGGSAPAFGRRRRGNNARAYVLIECGKVHRSRSHANHLTERVVWFIDNEPPTVAPFLASETRQSGKDGLFQGGLRLFDGAQGSIQPPQPKHDDDTEPTPQQDR